MKKLVLSLLGAATLAIASNAMALDTTRPYMAGISRGGMFTPAGVLVFDFDSEAFGPISGGGPLFPGSCVYAVEWISTAPGTTGPLPLSAQCFFNEQRIHGGLSCMSNALHGLPTVVNAVVDSNSMNDICDGVNPFGQISKILMLQLGEEFMPELTGLVQFDSWIANHTVYGLQLLGS